MIAILVIISIVITLVTIRNSVSITNSSTIDGIESELALEKRKVLDYITRNNLSAAASEALLVNFSRSFMQKVGHDKNTVFIIGDAHDIRLVGYRTNETTLAYRVDADFVAITDNDVDVNASVVGNNVTLRLDAYSYDFTLYAGQNLYYLVTYYYNEEEYIIDG